MPERTRDAIVDAFNRLIARKELEQITTLTIAKEARVSKATFYRYFKDKYDVMNYNYKSLLDDCLKQCKNYRELFYYLYRFARLHWSHLTKAFHSTGANSFENYIYTYSMDTALNITKANRDGEGFTPEESLQMDVFCYGVSYMYKKWTLDHYPLSADEAADALYGIMPESLKYYWYPD